VSKLADVHGAEALPEKPRIHGIGWAVSMSVPVTTGRSKQPEHAGNLVVIVFQKPDVRFHAAILHPIDSHGTGYAGLGGARVST
jgi:hypothetical protein